MINPKKLSLIQSCESDYEKFFINSAPEKLLELYEAKIDIDNYKVDFAIVKYKIAITCDKIPLDYKSPEEKKKELIKTEFLISNGWTVLRFTAQAIYAGKFACHAMIAEEITKFEPKIMSVKEFFSNEALKFQVENFSGMDIMTSGTFSKQITKYDRRKA